MATPSDGNRHFILENDVVVETNDWTVNEWLCRPDMTVSRELLMVRAIMEPFHCHPFHHHPHREEIIHVVEGRAEQWVGNEYRILGPGEVAIVPPGVPHGTFNPFPERLVFHAILTPAVLDGEKAADPDPYDVSGDEPWASMRNGMTPCKVLAVG